MKRQVILRAVKENVVAVSSLREFCEHGIALSSRTRRVAGEQCCSELRSLVDDPEIGRVNNFSCRYDVYEYLACISFEDDFITHDEFVNTQEDLVLTHSMPGDDDVALRAGHCCTRPVSGPKVECCQPDSLVEAHFDINRRNRDCSKFDYWLRRLCVGWWCDWGGKSGRCRR
jgi:hypothetical protein